MVINDGIFKGLGKAKIPIPARCFHTYSIDDLWFIIFRNEHVFKRLTYSVSEDNETDI